MDAPVLSTRQIFSVNRYTLRRSVCCGAILLLTFIGEVASAATIYWDGSGTTWNSTTSWSTSSSATTPDPAAVPGINDDAVFNISTVNTAQAVNLNADQSANALDFQSTGTTTLQGGGTNRNLTIGTGGIGVASGAGAVTIGSATSGQNVSIKLNGSQTWSNQSGNPLTIQNGVTNVGNLTPFTLTIAGTGDTTINGAITNGGATGTTALSMAGSGTLTLAGANTYSGGTTVNNGILLFSSATANSSLGAGSITVNSPGTAAAGYAIDQTFLGKIASTSNGTVALGANSSNNLSFSGLNNLYLGSTGAFTYSGTLTPGTNGYLLGGGGGTLTVSSVLSGSGTKLTTNGNVTLTGTNTYTGATTVNAGTLLLDFNTSGGATIVNSGSALSLGGGTLSMNTKKNTSNVETFASSTLTSGDSKVITSDAGGSTSGSMDLATLTRSVGATVDFAPGGSISIKTKTANTATSILGGWATVNGSTWAVSAGNGTTSGNVTGLATFGTSYSTATSATNFDATTNGTFTPTSVNSIRFDNGNARTATLNGAFSIGSGGILVTSNVGANLSTITGGTSLTSGNGTDLIVIQNNTSGNLAINSNIVNSAGSIGLTKSGQGTLILGGVNTYTGATTVNTGTLLVNGTIGSGASGGTKVTVANTGTLGGSGTIIGPSTTGTTAVTVNGTITAGTNGAAGTLAINNGSFGALTLTNTAKFNEDIGGTAAGTFDVINATGTVTLAGTLNISEFNSFKCKPGDLFTIISNDGADAITGTFANAPTNGSIINLGFDAYYVIYNGGDGNDLQLKCVPEPGTWLAAGLTLLFIGYTQRRKLVPALKRFTAAQPPS